MKLQGDLSVSASALFRNDCYTSGMSWEAQRWTAKTPSELYHTLGPHGVDELMRKALSSCWRNTPAENRTLASAMQFAREVFDRNIAVWNRIKKPSSEDFFADLQPFEPDHLMRQAMVTCWMMMPRSGGREVKDALRIVREIFDRNLEAWEEDEATFTGTRRKKIAKKASGSGATKPAKKPGARVAARRAGKK